jgi:hypothetical protein
MDLGKDIPVGCDGPNAGVQTVIMVQS